MAAKLFVVFLPLKELSAAMAPLDSKTGGQFMDDLNAKSLELDCRKAFESDDYDPSTLSGALCFAFENEESANHLVGWVFLQGKVLGCDFNCTMRGIKVTGLNGEDLDSFHILSNEA